jgi:hypothetical protein
MIHSKLYTVGGMKSNTLKTNKYFIDLLYYSRVIDVHGTWFSDLVSCTY